MRLLAFCPTLDAEPGLDRAERVHRVVLECFLPLLRGICETVVLCDPAQLAPLKAESQSRGERCLLLCFGPPHALPAELACRCVSVFDWAPDRPLDRAQLERWRTSLALGAALTLSPSATAAVRRTLGDCVAVRPIGIPVFDRWSAAPLRSAAPRGKRLVAVNGSVLDSRDYKISTDDFWRRTRLERHCTRPWSGAREELRFDVESEATAYLGGFYEPEVWGSWSRIANPWIMLPFALSGNVEVTFAMAAHGRNVGRTIEIEIGGVRRGLTVWDRFDEQRVAFELKEPAHVIQFLGLDTAEIPDAQDHRSLGLGIRWIALEGSTATVPAHASPIREQAVDGVVYTTLDADLADLHQSCWRDVIKAFCFTFRRERSATLVLHVRHPLPPFFARLHSLLHRMGPLACRIVVLHGELDAAQLRQLIDASTYYLHAPRCERLSVPLLQFMSAGVPVVVARHAQEISRATPSSGFVFDSILETPAWPTPERSEFFLGYHYPRWSSLVAAFAASHRLARRRPAEYAQLSRAAREAHATSSSDAVVAKELAEVLQLQGLGSDA